MPNMRLALVNKRQAAIDIIAIHLYGHDFQQRPSIARLAGQRP